ncbi:hypothetical protein MW887_006844 [Aspergillus wentii]|nr:hypothetical protein MW887_006844 [Aspergillus wentii]
MPQLRWLPSMMSRSQQNTHPNPNTTLPTISSNLRMGRNSDHQPVSVVVETRPTEDSADASDSEHSENSVSGTNRDVMGMDAPGDPDYVQSPPEIMGQGATRRGSGMNAVGTRSSTVGGGGGGAPMVLIGDDDDDNGADDTLTGGMVGGGGDVGGDTSRKHGKRLTTKEEVSLFDLCNRHAHEFGQRSNLCKWWMTVTAEFTREQGHPYSWHSVRRKVELVTKQRMKFLEEQRDKGGNGTEDLSNPRWRAAVDAWIPTWQRWEEAEAKRIEKRDSRKSRKRKDRTWDSWDGNSDNWRLPSSPVVDAGNTSTASYQSQTPSQPQPAASTSSMQPPAPPPNAITSTPSQNTVRLPPGFDSMFSTPSPHTSSRPAPSGYQNYTQQQQPTTSSTTPNPAETNNMMAAMLETLGKINKHLDAAQSNPRSSPIISAVASTPTQATPEHTRAITGTDSEDVSQVTAVSISKLKEELRQEMQAELRQELEKDRASLEEKLDSVQRTQEMILEMLRQEPA